MEDTDQNDATEEVIQKVVEEVAAKTPPAHQHKPDNPTHRQLRRAQILIEKATGQRYEFLEIVRAVVRQEVNGLHIGAVPDNRAVMQLARKVKNERERQQEREQQQEAGLQ